MLAFAVASVLLFTPPGASPGSRPPATYQIDVTHSRLTFRIRHLVSRVEGRFERWSGTLLAESDDLRTGKVEVQIDAASLSTGNAARDQDLRSPNFFDVEAFPVIRFSSNRVVQHGTALQVHGTLTIRGITRAVRLEGEFVGRQLTAHEERLGFEARTTINRTDFGVSWNRAVEGGGVLLGDEVTIEMSVAAVREI